MRLRQKRHRIKSGKRIYLKHGFDYAHIGHKHRFEYNAMPMTNQIVRNGFMRAIGHFEYPACDMYDLRPSRKNGLKHLYPYWYGKNFD